MAKSELEKYKEAVSARLSQLSPLLQKYALGDFSESIQVPEEEDEFTGLLVGLSLTVDDIKELIEEKESTITQLKRAEEALRESMERYHSTLDSMLEGCQIIGHDWRYVYLNDTAAFHGQRSKEELLGRTMMESYPGIERTDMFAALKRCMDEHTPCRMENEFTYPDGSKGWFELSIQPMLEGIFILSLDISERKRAEVALQEAEVRYRSLVEQIPAIVYTDSATQIGQTLYINPQLKTIVGYGPEEWLADNDLWLKIMHPDDHDRVLAEYTCANENGEPFHAEYRMITRDSRIVWIRDEATLTRDPSGHPLFWQGIMLDITERKRAEEELAQRVEELERFNRLAVGRELRMVELKRQINELSEQLGKEPPYDLSFVEQQ